tara:strand:+ start:914 stop:1294 length:381 start_codon:yes stop_codon:yes gene_type:complete
MLKHIIKSLNKNCNKNNLFKRSLCNLALDNKYFQYYNNDNNDYNNNENLFIEKVNYDTKKRYLIITKHPYYLDEDYVKENYFEKLKKMNIIYESSGSKCFNCHGTGLTFNGFKYEICSLCNGNGIY